jgi:hypothetical protein
VSARDHGFAYGDLAITGRRRRDVIIDEMVTQRENTMLTKTSLLIAAGLTIALTGAASAQSMTPEINDGIARVVTATSHGGGRLVMRHAGPRQAAAVIRSSGSNGFYLLNNSVTRGVTTFPRCKGWVGEC